jgi:nicotinate-nucleotide adenylyltransferase
VKVIGVLAGAFNPVTLAHLALVDAARPSFDEIVCVVPRVYPHKEFHGASLEDRLEMLRRASDRYRVQATEGGLFIDIARELRRGDPDAEIFFICGSDAAERIVSWDYGEQGTIERLMEEFQLLVAARRGTYHPPEHLRGRVHALALDRDVDEISSTEIRRRIAAGEPWDHLVPGSVADLVSRIYRPNQIAGRRPAPR